MPGGPDRDRFTRLHAAQAPASRVTWQLVADTRNCEQCGAVFAPRREHARFCSARCRVAWNGENMSDPTAEVSVLDWSSTAMREATGRLLRVRAWDRPRAFVVIGEAVWWVTMVDSTLVRYHPGAYDGVMGSETPAERRLIEGTLAGLRFVRNRLGQDVDLIDFIKPEPSCPAPDNGGILAWTWKSAPAPALASLPPRAHMWEMTRYRAYQAQLAGRPIGETFGRAAAFLTLTATRAMSVTDNNAQAAVGGA